MPDAAQRRIEGTGDLPHPVVDLGGCAVETHRDASDSVVENSPRYCAVDHRSIRRQRRDDPFLPGAADQIEQVLTAQGLAAGEHKYRHLPLATAQFHELLDEPAGVGRGKVPPRRLVRFQPAAVRARQVTPDGALPKQQP
jgi:hypothetical protein